MTTSAGDRPLTIAAVGDVMMDRDVGRHFARSPADFAMPAIRSVFHDVDLVLANLENPVATSGRPDLAQDPNVTFRAAPATVAALRELGVGAVSLGNNHLLDYGDAALVETLERLDAAGIEHAGAGRDYEEANRPLVLERAGRQIAILSHPFMYSVNSRMATASTPGIADHRIGFILPRIRSLAAGGAMVIVSAHWGFEYRLYPLRYQMTMARRMVDAGATLVLGHGPHYPQGIERRRGREIVYSLGNFIFDEPFALANIGYIYTAAITSNDRVQSRLRPYRITDHVPTLLPQRDAARMNALVTRLSREYRRAPASRWRAEAARYAMELIGRSLRGRSLKYLRVPPLRFYAGVSATTLAGEVVRRAIGRARSRSRSHGRTAA